MSPSPQKHATAQIECEVNPLDGEKVVISGMSGLFAQSHNIKELNDILYNKVNPVTPINPRWNYYHPELAAYSGKTPEMTSFDAQFFKVHHFIGNNMDAMARKGLEQAYQAIYDAGVCPSHLNGKKVAVYIGVSCTESDRTNFYAPSKQGFGLIGCSKTMFANRISYWLNIKGPSLSIDESCCSSSTALEQGYLAIKRGECEAAIVGGYSMKSIPPGFIHYNRIIEMSKDDKTKSFDENAEGCVHSDATTIVFLQKAKDALRIYAEVVHVKTEYRGLINGSTGPIFGFRRVPGDTIDFMQQFYKEARVPAEFIEYVEALGSATPEADLSELQAIEDVFTKKRTDTLLVGSVTSNVGFTQAASGLTAIIKVLLAYHSGEIAANLHCKNPRQDVEGLREGRMRIVTEHQSFRRSYVAVNGMSVTGVNSHVLLHGRYKPKDLSKYLSNIPRLVTISGRQETGVTKVIEDLKSRPIDPEEIALLHNIHSSNISGHLGRGYVILDSNEDHETVCLSEKSEYFNDTRRPLWFVYSGMGSQWAGMGVQLMRMPIFAAAIERCHRVLATKGLDLVHIITSLDQNIFENVLHSFVGIAAIQIGLTDMLRELGLEPDGIIGHSVGEMGCAYADGCLTAEEMILAAYSRGRVSLETKLIRGSMAAVGLGFEKILPTCPPEIQVACHNGPESSTISGPADVMKEFVAELTAKGIFAKEVPCSNIAYHSRYIADAGPGLLKYLTETIKDPKPRSERWYSTSVPQKRWHEPAAKYCSAEYLTNNLLSPVLFDETSRLIPNNAVLVEVAPHGLLQAILKRSLPASCRHVPLTKRGHPDNVLYLLQAVGNLYTEGYNPKIQVLYPKMQFPVSTGTPMLSHLVEWFHTYKWKVPCYMAANKIIAYSCKFVISVHDEEHSYLRGHVLREKTVFPFAAALVAVWDTYAMYWGNARRQVSVQFHDVYLHAQPTLHDQQPLRLSVALHRGNGRFEIMNGAHKIATGYLIRKSSKERRDIDEIYNLNDNDHLQSQHVYQLFGDRDYQYSDEFQSLVCASASLNEAVLMWRDNWVTLIDGMLQLNMLRQAHDGVSLPTHIRRLDINVKRHSQSTIFDMLGKERLMKINISDFDDCTSCGGVSVNNITFKNLPVRKQNYQFKLTVLPALQLPQNKQKITLDVYGQRTLAQQQLSLQIEQPGDLSSLFWAESPAHVSGLAVTVHYAGLNITDASKATGTAVSSDSNSTFGMDFSGTLQSGERVMGLVGDGAARSVVRAQPELLWPVPAHWSLEDAATVPLAYAHALYCLRVKAQLRPGMSVLIHGGAGALGQAAISVALALNCQVFTTVSDVLKKQFVKKLYPQIRDDFIGNSRDSTFADMVLSKTNGNGCHVVLSCLKPELKVDAMRCCHLMGITLDTVQIKYREKYYLRMYSLENDRTYSLVDFSSIYGHQNSEERKLLQTMLSEGIRRGYVRPLSRVTYAPHDAARAFRLLALSGHRGRVLLRLQHEKLKAQCRVCISPDTCHLLVCDEGPLGMQLAERLVSRGANKLYIVFTSANAYNRFKISALRKLAVDIKLYNGRLHEKNAVMNIMKDAFTLGPVEGIYVAVSTIENNKINELNDFIDKLDLTARSTCSSVKYFAVLSFNIYIGQKSCLSRAKQNLPATLMDLSNLTNTMCHRDIIDALENAMIGPHAVHLAPTERTQSPGLLQQLTTLTGISLSSKDDSTTIQELHLTNDIIQAMLMVFRDTHNINIEEEEIFQLTVAKIKELNDRTADEFKDVRGLATFFSYVDLDEQLASTDVVLMSTLAKNIIMGDEFDVDKKYLCIVPGMEGHHERFRVLCERLKLPALVLQPGFDHPGETVRETAQRYAQILLKKVQITDNFYLLGYESGVLVALEVAAILEDRGLTGIIFCVGYAPGELSVAIDDQLADFKSEDHIQNALLRHMFTLMSGRDLTELEKVLKGEMTWSERLDECVRLLLGRVPHSAQYTRGLIKTAWESIERTRSYVAPARALRSQLVLLRAASAHATSPVQALRQHSQRPIAIHQLTTPLAQAASDMRLPSIIHKHLTTDILQQFHKENLCDSYFLHDDVFSSTFED